MVSRGTAAAAGMTSWGDVDEALRQLGTVEARIAQKNAALTEEVNRMRAQVEQTVQPLELEKARLTKEIEDFCRRHRGDFGGKRSRTLNFGVVAFRVTTRVEVEDEPTTLAALRARELTACVNVKETVNKAEVAKLAGDVLQQVGAYVVKGDAFQAKPDREKVVLTAED